VGVFSEGLISYFCTPLIAFSIFAAYSSGSATHDFIALLSCPRSDIIAADTLIVFVTCLLTILNGVYVTCSCRNRAHLCVDGQNCHYMEEIWHSGKLAMINFNFSGKARVMQPSFVMSWEIAKFVMHEDRNVLFSIAELKMFFPCV